MGLKNDSPKSVFSGVLLALIVFFIVIPLGGVMTCMVCAKMRADKATETARATPADPTPTSTAPEMNAPGAVTYPPGEEPVSVTASLANFTKDTRLETCFDFTISGKLWPGMARQDAIDALTKAADGWAEDQKKALHKRGWPTQGFSKIGKSCSEQFRTNPVLATCTSHQHITGDAGRAADFDATTHYYDLDTLTKNDQEMKGCIDGKGDWQAVSKDSDEYREAVRARARREVEHLQEQLAR